MLTTAIARASPSASVTPLTVIEASVWFGGQRLAVLGYAALQSGAALLELTVTVNVIVVVLPARSIDRQVTVLTPIGKSDPGGGVQTTGSVPSTASMAVGVA